MPVPGLEPGTLLVERDTKPVRSSWLDAPLKCLQKFIFKYILNHLKAQKMSVSYIYYLEQPSMRNLKKILNLQTGQFKNTQHVFSRIFIIFSFCFTFLNTEYTGHSEKGLQSLKPYYT